jgi:hypothetical protein
MRRGDKPTKESQSHLPQLTLKAFPSRGDWVVEEKKSPLGCSEERRRGDAQLWAGFRLVARREPSPSDGLSLNGAP